MPGPHDFAVRDHAVRLARSDRSRVSSTRPATATARTTPSRPPHPIPTSVTIAIRPSCGMRRRNYKFDLGLRRSEIFFARGLDRKFRTKRDLPVGQITSWTDSFSIVADDLTTARRKGPAIAPQEGRLV